MMWGQKAKSWLQEKTQEIASKTQEVRQTRLMSDIEAHGKNIIHNLVAAGTKINEQEILYNVRFTPITPRVIGMAFPTPPDSLARLLSFKYGPRYMLWNLSEEAYDYSLFDNQVLEFKFPGYPSPPLGLMVKLCLSIENWLQADDQNVAIVHCLTGKGRTATVLAAVLCWLGIDVGQQPPGSSASTMQALHFVAERMGMAVHKATIPSQRRYLQYFHHMTEGIKPRPQALLLTRVIMNTIPLFGSLPPSLPKDAVEGGKEGGGEEEEEAAELLGCCPYLQLFKSGKLIYTAPCSRDGSNGEGGREGVTHLPWSFPSDGSIIFNVDCLVQGDILIRARHLTASGQKISMFRAAFHTGYVPCGVLRLGKAQLDGACADGRFDEGFFIDCIFAAPGGKEEGVTCTSPSSNMSHTSSTSTSTSTSTTTTTSSGNNSGKCSSSTTNTSSSSRNATVSQEDYDSILHNDTRFWNEISARKKRAATRARQQQRQQQQQQQQPSSSSSSSSSFLSSPLSSLSSSLISQRPPPSTAAARPTFSISENMDEDDNEEEDEGGKVEDDSTHLRVFDATPRDDSSFSLAFPPSSQLPSVAVGGREGGRTGGGRSTYFLPHDDDDLLLGEDPSHHAADWAQDDLLLQLQAATATTTNTTAIATSSAGANAGVAEGRDGKKEGTRGGEVAVVATAGAVGPSAPASAMTTHASSFDELENLEKEIGFDALSMSSSSSGGEEARATTTTTTAAATAGAVPSSSNSSSNSSCARTPVKGAAMTTKDVLAELEALDDGLEEFEGYLKSLEK